MKNKLPMRGRRNANKFIYCTVIALLLGCDDGRVDVGNEQHRHNFPIWSEVFYTNDWNYGTRAWQSRTCFSCREAEVREVVIKELDQ